MAERDLQEARFDAQLRLLEELQTLEKICTELHPETPNPIIGRIKNRIEDLRNRLAEGRLWDEN